MLTTLKVQDKQLILTAEDESEEELLKIIKALNVKKGLVPLMSTFIELINKGVMKQWNGKWIWNEEWEVVKEHDPAYL